MPATNNRKPLRNSAKVLVRFRLGSGTVITRRASFDARFVGIEREKIVSRAIQAEAADLQRFASNGRISLVSFEVA